MKSDEDWTSILLLEFPCDRRTELSGRGVVPSNSAPTRKGSDVDDEFFLLSPFGCAESKNQFVSNIL